MSGERPSIAIAGGGIGGLALALALHAEDVPCRVYEASREIRALGVGINLLPHAVRVLSALGVADRLAAHAVVTGELAYYNRHGQLIWSEPRGRDAGYDFPQYSVHRGLLQTTLLEAVRERLGAGCVVTGRPVRSFRETADGVEVSLAEGRDGAVAETVTAGALVGADGIHSTVRAQLHPDDGGPRYSGRMLWRSITRAPSYLTGRTMIMAGHQDTKFVCYPITPPDGAGKQDVNWIAELTVPGDSPPPQDWSRVVPSSVFREPFTGWRFGWLDVPSLIDGAQTVYEYPLSDREPLERWGSARVTLLGDAAHPMYPIGSNGASQAILDAEALARALAAEPEVTAALAVYEASRRPPTSQIVLANRQNGPEQVMQLAEERAPDGFSDVEDVIPRAELEEIADRYKRMAGFARDQVNRS